MCWEGKNSSYMTTTRSTYKVNGKVSSCSVSTTIPSVCMGEMKKKLFPSVSCLGNNQLLTMHHRVWEVGMGTRL